MLNRIKGAVTSGQDPHPAKHPTCETVLRRSSEGNHQNQKADGNVFERGGMFQPHQAAELGSFGHTVLTLELRIQEKGYGLSLHD